MRLLDVVGSGNLACVVDEPVVQDKISSRGQKVVFLASTIILRHVDVVVGVDRRWDLEACTATGLEAVFIALVDNAFVDKARVGVSLQFWHGINEVVVCKVEAGPTDSFIERYWKDI
jgi:hypothetical protein